ncbi:MAG: TonB-dependent receptor, partial [Pseudomonadota bacterium]
SFDSTVVITTQGPGFPPLTTIENANESWAVFGQVSYDLTDRLNLTGGVRYTEDERNFRAIAAAAATVNPTRVKDEDVSWDISALYKVNPEVNVYVRVADGFRGPTIQGRDVAFSPGSVDAQTTADSEDILSFEAGIKTALLNNRARINIAGYHYRVDNQQFSIIGGAGNLSQVINADRGVGYGFEADAEFLLLDNWFMSLGFSFNDTEIRDDQLATDPCGSGLCTVLDPLNGFGQALVDGNPFPNAPLTTFNAFTEYTIPLPFGGDLFVNTDWALQGETNFFLYEAEEFTVSGNFEGGARIGYRDTERGYEVAVFARNITNEENLRGAIDFNNLTGFINEPRVIGAQLTFSR